MNDLLLLARLDSGRPLRHDAVDLTRVVLDVVTDTQALDPSHHWTLDLPELEVVIDGDENSLRQVVVNLLGNTVEHTPPGTRTTITLAENDHDVALVVADDGPGIPAEFLPHIFERFARADSARAHASGESGLGLAIVEAIAHAHGGSISVTSKPGATVFTLRVPRPSERRRSTAG